MPKARKQANHPKILSAEKLKATKLQLLRTEIDVGHTFATIALETRNKETKSRNTHNARRAYDTIVKFMAETNFSPDETEEIEAGMARLQEDLTKLEETGLF